MRFCPHVGAELSENPNWPSKAVRGHRDLKCGPAENLSIIVLSNFASGLFVNVLSAFRNQR
jgi:hypothetical protein